MNNCCIYLLVTSSNRLFWILSNAKKKTFRFFFKSSLLLCYEFDWLYLKENKPVNAIQRNGIHQPSKVFSGALTNQSFSKSRIKYDSVSVYPINVSCVYLYIFGTSYGFVSWTLFFSFLLFDQLIIWFHLNWFGFGFFNYRSHFHKYFWFYFTLFSVCVHQPELL